MKTYLALAVLVVSSPLAHAQESIDPATPCARKVVAAARKVSKAEYGAGVFADLHPGKYRDVINVGNAEPVYTKNWYNVDFNAGEDRTFTTVDVRVRFLDRAKARCEIVGKPEIAEVSS